MTEIIAEFCQNHMGDYGLISEMLHQARESGATYAKIQTIFPEDLVLREQFEEGVVKEGKIIHIKRPYKIEFERLQKLVLNYDDHMRFIDDCKRYGLKSMTTCFTRGSIVKLSKFPWDAIKVASYDCGSHPMITELAQIFKNVIVSTGASFDSEIEQTADILKSAKIAYAFLHCVTIYPTPLDEIHLNRLNYLRRLTPEIGLSDHTLVARDGVKASLGAIYFGAKYIERHFTILDSDKTKDGPVSIKPQHLKELAEFDRLSKEDQLAYIKDKIPEYEKMLGLESRELSEAELLNRDYYRGRFATHAANGIVFNWEDKQIN